MAIKAEKNLYLIVISKSPQKMKNKTKETYIFIQQQNNKWIKSDLYIDTKKSNKCCSFEHSIH